MRSSSNNRERDQQMITVMQDKEKGMGSKGNAATTIIGTTDRMRPRKKDRTGSMQHLAGNTRENTFGENAHSMRMETTTRVIIEGITTITGEIREIPM